MSNECEPEAELSGVDVEPEDRINGETSGAGNEDSADITFDPPLYKQRYSVALTLLDDEKVGSVAEFGCAECRLLSMLKNVAPVSRAYGVDIDGQLLLENKFKIRPLTADYLITRQLPLTIDLMQGSIAEYDHRLSGIEAVVMLELIEHLYDDVLSAFPKVVFGQLQPRLVYVTTPNSEFNVLFPNFSGFRHSDHKFEWTRSEFQSWGDKVGAEYGYSVEYGGIGNPPEDRWDLGHCSQSALFRKIEPWMPQETETSSASDADIYQLVCSSEFPGKTESDELTHSDIEYYVRMLAISEQGRREAEDEYVESSEHQISLESIYGFRKISSKCESVTHLKSIIEENCHFNLTSDGLSIQYDLEDEESEEESVDNCSQENDDYELQVQLESAEEESWDTLVKIDEQFLDSNCSEGAVMPAQFNNCWAFPVNSDDSDAKLNHFTPGLETPLRLTFSSQARRYREQNARRVEENQFDDV